MSNLTGDNGMVMPVSPMYGQGGGFGGWGDSAWIIILLLFAFGGFGGGFGGGMNGMFYPFMNQVEATQSGFNQAATQSTLAGINNAITQGFSSQEVAACNRAMQTQATEYNNQIASMNQSFANAQALDARLDTITMNQQKCCCDNQAAVADLKYTIAQEGAATRAAGLEQTQSVLDKLCQLELDAKNDKIADLQNQLNMATLRESQVAQTAQLIQDNNGQTRELINRIAPFPQAAYIVPNPYGCNGYNYGYTA